MKDPIRILLVDDSPYFLEAARDFLRLQEALTVVDVATGEQDALSKSLEGNPDVILLDLNLAQRSGLELIPLFRQRLPNVKIIVLTMMDADIYRAAALKAGADAFVHKASMSKVLVSSILNLMGGEDSAPVNLARPAQDPNGAEVPFLRLAEHLPDLIYRYEFAPVRGFTYVSPSAAAMTGYTPEEHYADPDLGFKLVHPDDLHLLRAVAEGKADFTKPLVLRWIHKDGRIFWTEQHNVPIYDAAGNLIACEGIARDITERKQTEEALRESEEHQRAFAELATDYVYIVRIEADGKPVMVWSSDSFARISGYSVEEIESSGGLFALIHPDDLPNSHANFERMMKGERVVTEIRVLKKSGDILHVRNYSRPVFDESGNRVVRIIGAGQDVTEHKQAEEAVRRFQLRYRGLFNQVHDAVFILDLEGNHIDANERAAQMLGYSLDELKKLSLIETSAELEQSYAMLGRLRAGETLPVYERLFKKKSGEVFPVEINVELVRDDAGKPLHVQSVVRDISERKQAEANRAYQANLLAHISDAVVATDADMIIRSWNNAAEIMFGYTAEEVIGQSARGFLSPEYINTTRERVFQQLAETGHWVGEVRLRHKDGRVVHAITSGSMLKDSTGNATGFLSINHDITERKQAEQALQDQSHALARSNTLITALSNVALRAATSFDTQAIMDTLGRELKQLKLDAVIALLEPDTRSLVVNFSTPSGSPALARAEKLTGISMVGFRIERDRWLGLDQVLDQGRPLFIPNSLDFVTNLIKVPLPRLVLKKALGWVNVKNDNPILCLPLTVNERVLGILFLWGSDLRESDTMTGLVFSAQIAAALENARLYQVAQQELAERKRAEEKTRINEERLKLATHAGRVGVWDWDIVKDELIWDDSMYALYGIDPKEFGGAYQAWNNAVHPDDRENTDAEIQSALRNEREYAPEFRIVRPDGGIRFIKATAQTIRDQEGKALRMVGTNVDITERKQAEAQIKDLLVFNEKVINHSPIGILTYQLNGECMSANENAAYIVGTSVATLKAQNFRTLASWKKSGLYDLIEKAITSRVPVTAELHHISTFGKDIWLTAYAVIFKSKDEEHVLLTISDITERRQAEERIQRQLAYLNALRDIDRAINSTFDMQVSLNTLISRIIPILTVDAAAVLLFNPVTHALEFAAGAGFRTEAIRASSIKLGQSYAGRVALERRTIQVPDLALEPRNLFPPGFLENEDFAGYYGAPLIVKGKVIGVLEVFHRSVIERDAEWLDVFEMLAGQAAIAIEQAQMFEDLQHANDQLEHRVAERTAELEQVNLELQHANRAKDEFLANVSHELRTPLNSILGLSETLLEQRRDPLSERQQRSLQIVESSGRHLLELINDVLDLSKIEAGKFDYYPQVIEVGALCQSSLSIVRQQAMRKSIELNLEEDPAAPKLHADLRRMKQILVNLLMNAVKFTAENGKINLQIRSDAERDLIQFSVIDTGIGIAVEDMKKLFQPFSQVDSSLTREYEGSGLGLALVQKLTDLHGGSVEVDSEPGIGSRFTVNIPWRRELVAQDEAIVMGRPPPVSEANSISRSMMGGRILLAEDNMANVLTVGEYLESHGFEVVTASDGLQAIELTEETNPELILMDIQMPALDGLEAIRRLRKNPRFASTPIIALTALAMPGDRERCLEAGADEYLSKPVSLKLLVETMNRLLGAKKSKSANS